MLLDNEDDPIMDVFNSEVASLVEDNGIRDALFGIFKTGFLKGFTTGFDSGWENGRAGLASSGEALLHDEDKDWLMQNAVVLLQESM